MDEDTGPRRSPGGRGHRKTLVIAATMLLSLAWPVLWTVAHGSSDALLGVGRSSEFRPPIEREIPGVAAVDEVGHDGQQYYLIARHPFSPDDSGLNAPGYRYRRILFPLLAATLAPAGGRPLIWSFLALSLIGVGLAAWALATLPSAPRWLPFTAALNPAVATSLTLSLADALGAGLALAAVALAGRSRWGPMVVATTLAVLTRETFLLVAVGLLVVPGMPLRWRAATIAAPAGLLVAWSAWVSGASGSSPGEGSGEQLTTPFAGWVSGAPDVGTLVMAALALALLLVGAWRVRRETPHVALLLALQAALVMCLSERVAFSWTNSLRTAVPLLPLAIWAVVVDLGALRHPPVGAPAEATDPAREPVAR